MLYFCKERLKASNDLERVILYIHNPQRVGVFCLTNIFGKQVL